MHAFAELSYTNHTLSCVKTNLQFGIPSSSTSQSHIYHRPSASHVPSLQHSANMRQALAKLSLPANAFPSNMSRLFVYGTFSAHHAWYAAISPIKVSDRCSCNTIINNRKKVARTIIIFEHQNSICNGQPSARVPGDTRA